MSDHRRGRDEVVAALFDEQYGKLCRLAAFLLDDASAAEEVVQEAFLRTFAGWWRIRHPERAAGYLRTAVVNQCRSRGRRRVTESRGNRAVWTGEGGHGTGADADPDRTEDALVVMGAVRSLPRRQREAIVLRYYGDLSEVAVAAALGCTVGTVKSQLAKARATLARRLGEGLGERPDPTGAGPHDERCPRAPLQAEQAAGGAAGSEGSGDG